MLKKVVYTGLASSLAIMLVGCGKEKSSDKQAPPKAGLSLAEISGRWVPALAKIPLVETYKTEDRVDVRQELTPTYRFSSNSFTTYVKCTFKVLDEIKTVEAVATADIIPTDSGFVVKKSASDMRYEFAGGKPVICSTDEIATGSYTLQKSGDLIIMKSPGNDAEELLKPFEEK